MKYLAIIGWLALAVSGFAFAQSNVPAADAESHGEVTFRCAYWKMPDDPPQVFVKEKGDYVYLNILNMAFARPYTYRGALPIPIFRKATEAEIAQRKAEGTSGSDAEYIPVLSIDPRGMKDIGVIFLPGAFARKTENLQLVFDYSEKAFPYGSIRILNFSHHFLFGQLLPRGENRCEYFKMKNGESFLSRPFTDERKIYEIRLAAIVNSKSKRVFSSSAAFYNTNRVMFFIIPDDEKTAKDANALPRLDFRCLSDRKRPDPKPEAQAL